MKTHSLAKTLRTLADILESYPNTELSDMSSPFWISGSLNKKQVAVNLKTLHSLSKIKKKEWVELIRDYGFNIEIKLRDSSRNIIGKLLNYLDANPNAINTLKRKAQETREEPSALTQALDTLLEDL
jgi:hypothetical protein